MTARRRRRPKPIGPIVDQVLGDFGVDRSALAFRINEHWAEAVGSDVASHARPILVRGHVLEVEVDSSVWCQQLQMQSPQLIAALREVLGDASPSELRFRVGYNRRR